MTEGGQAIGEGGLGEEQQLLEDLGDCRRHLCRLAQVNFATKTLEVVLLVSAKARLPGELYSSFDCETFNAAKPFEAEFSIVMHF